MLKRAGAILFICVYTYIVFSLALNSPSGSSNIAITQTRYYLKCNTAAINKTQCAISKRVVIIKSECRKESKSLFSKLFAFEIPKLPLEDFLLAAQKALIEKLF